MGVSTVPIFITFEGIRIFKRRIPQFIKFFSLKSPLRNPLNRGGPAKYFRLANLFSASQKKSYKPKKKGVKYLNYNFQNILAFVGL